MASCRTRPDPFADEIAALVSPAASRHVVLTVLAVTAIAALAGFPQPATSGPQPSATTKHVSPQCARLDASLQALPPAEQKTAIGMLFAQGQCRPLDHEQALANLRDAAKLGDSDAMYDFFVTSAGKEAKSADRNVRHEQTEGVTWLQKSANWRAALVLGGVCYKNGACGLKRNPDLAQTWCQRYAALAPPDQVARQSDCDMTAQPATQPHSN